MSVIRYEPWQFVNRLHRELEAAADGGVAWLPAVDIQEEDDRFVVRADLPGVDSKDIEITAENGSLTLRGLRRFEKRGEARFQRHFTLPDTAQVEQIRAKQLNGVLEVSIPKQPQVQPKRIVVEAA